MKLNDFNYHLPEELIAQHPAVTRDAARLLVHDLAQDSTQHRHVSDLMDFLVPGDLLVVNDTRVLPTRLYGQRASGGRVEFLMLDAAQHPDAQGEVWSALVNPARKLKPGELVPLEGGSMVARMLERPRMADGKPAKEWLVELVGTGPEGKNFGDWLERFGHMPLPPYIKRSAGDPEAEREDRERYQTVYAENLGAVAAPTAGLHFTPELLARLEAGGVRRAQVTLHVGHGTFRPMDEPRVEDHRMHAERYELSNDVAEAVRETRARGGRVVAAGTTSVRVLETCADGETGLVQAGSGATRLFLYPGKRLHVVDALFTNFHLPQSSLLLLVSAFAGRERILRLYAEAVRERYRFFSYGDAMLLSAPPGRRDFGDNVVYTEARGDERAAHIASWT